MDTTYKKRAGTSGISGQLYETKLLSLLYFRLLRDDNVQDFYLASNMDEIGAFDDICIKIQLKQHTRPVILFIQVKHKDNDDKFVTFGNNNDLVKWSQSILKIKQKFGSGKNCDDIFNFKYSDAECVFVCYTNAKYGADTNNPHKGSVATHLNNLLVTKDTVGCRPLYTERDVHNFSDRILKDEIIILAERFTRYLYDKANQSMNIMNNDYILRYHVILAMKVVQISKIKYDKTDPNLKWRELTFQSEFFNTNDKHIVLLRKYMYEKIHEKLRENKMADTKAVRDILTSELVNEELINRIFNDSSIHRKSHEKVLKEKFTSPFTKAKEIIARDILLSLRLKVPVSFGNVDLTMRGNEKKIENRLNYLTDIIVGLCRAAKTYNSYKIITIDEMFDEGILSPNGGLGGAVGNVLGFDEKTKLLKFSDPNNCSSLQNNAKTLFIKLQSKIVNLHEYRFVVKTMKFPRLTFDCEEISKDFFSNLVVYEKQSNHYEIEEILKKEIDILENTNFKNLPVETDSVFLYYHNEIQKWWMSSKIETYLTKSSYIYQQSINNIVIEPHMSGLQNMFYINKVRNIAYIFTEKAMLCLQNLDNASRSIIETDITIMTTMKVIQYLRQKNNQKYVILDIEYISNMATEDFLVLSAEIKNTDKVLLIVCDNIQNNNYFYKRLIVLSKTTNGKHVIVIIQYKLVDILKEYFPYAGDDALYEKQKLDDLTSESGASIISNAQILFQGHNSSLDLLLEDSAIKCINGTVLDKIVRNEPIAIGDTLSNSNYENMKHLYIERRLSEVSDYTSIRHFHLEYEVKSFFDITEEAVLVTAKPGMGKSTLLTHLSLKTKEIDSTVWIVRINLVEHSKEFYNWQENKTDINIAAALEFICKVIIRNYNSHFVLKETNNIVYLEDCVADDWATFELNLFLHFYNNKKVIFLFDGFDEICPHYKNNVKQFLNVVRRCLRKNKIWVTSRPYSDILPALKEVLEKVYEIGYFDDIEQELYFKRIWRSKLIFEKLTKTQLNNAISYINFIDLKNLTMRSIDAMSNRFFRIYLVLYGYIYSHLPHIPPRIYSSFYKNELDSYMLHDTALDIDTQVSQLRFNNSESDTLLGTPLLIYLLADYFANLILNENTNRWQSNVNIHTIYTMFIESKLKTILFQDKNKMDIYNPNVITRYEKERNYCLDMHKKIAAYVLLGSPILNGLNLEELKDMDPLKEGGLKAYDDLIISVKNGTEKSGLISHVTAENVPVFIHRTFAEYFAAEFICDILLNKNFNFETKKLLYTTTNVCHGNDLSPWIIKRREWDKKLNDIVMTMESILPLFSSWRLGWFRNILAAGNLPIEQYIRLINSGPNDYENDNIDEYINYTQILNNLQHKEIVIAKMKPHLRKYFSMTVSDHRTKSFVSKEISIINYKYVKFKKTLEKTLPLLYKKHLISNRKDLQT